MKNKDFFLAFKLKLSDAVFILLINVKIPTIVGIFTLMSRLKNSCSAKLSMEKVYNSVPGVFFFLLNAILNQEFLLSPCDGLLI